MDKLSQCPSISLAQKCVLICKTCKWYRPEKLTKDNSEAPMPIRVAGNMIFDLFKQFGIEPFRCGKCGCFGSLKAKLLQGKGCPLHKWQERKSNTIG